MSNKKIKDFFDKKALHWDSHEVKTQDQLRKLLRFLPIAEGMKVVDLACGTGVVTEILYEMSKTKITAIDISPKMIEQAKKKISSEHADFIVGDYLNLSLNKADFTVIFNAYPHFLDTEKLIDALYNNLREDGYFAIVHSLGRKQLEKTHSGEVNSISRTLLPAEDEAKKFKDKFNVIKAKEGEDYYCILCRKK